MTKTGLYLTFVLTAGACFGDKPPLDCSKKSLAAAVDDAEPGEKVSFTGVCAGPIVIRTDSISLAGVGVAVIDGHGQDAVSIAGAHGVTLNSIEIRNGLNGVVGTNGAHLRLVGITVHDNILSGISLSTASSAVLNSVITRNNGLHGLDLRTGSAATINKAFTSSGNRVFGINDNGSSLTFSQANATISGNALGIQVATSSNAFIEDATTSVNASNNFATGLTVVSGAHMVSFGGSITASNNGVNGVSVNSKGGLDLDAGAVLTVSGNGSDGLVLQEQSVMTVFNIPQFSGVPAVSTVKATSNTGSGVSVLTGSTLTVSNQARVEALGNTLAGIQADNGAGVTFQNTASAPVSSTATGNTGKDLQTTFGSRVDLGNLTFGTYTCDGTVLARGTVSLSCPH